ncbi:MAG: hypothetical protein PHY72_01945 [Candidatus Pacebacteria bacterium]|nr:hypothetical protein [Candidatus Paceibacterota bacterium]
MKNYVVILVAYALIGQLCIVNSTHALSAAELWYPGGTGSSWVYTTPAGSTIEDTAEDTVVLDGIRYRVVKETSTLAGGGDDTIIDPFLTFREDGKNHIVSYGEGMNEKLKNSIVDVMIESCLGLIGEGQILVSSLYKEWVLLDGNAGPNGTWTVMRTRTIVDLEGLGLEDILEIREIDGSLGPLTPVTIMTKDGPEVFQAYELRYSYSWSIGGPFGDDQDLKELFIIFLVPQIGAVRIVTGDQKANDLFEYRILPFEQSVQRKGKLSVTWGDIKSR